MVCLCVCVLSFCVCPTLSVLMDCSLPGPLSMGFSNQEYWSGLLFPSPGDLPSPKNEPTTLLNVMWLPCQDGSVGRMDTYMHSPYTPILTGKSHNIEQSCGFVPWAGKIPWRRKEQPTPVFLVGKCHGQWSWQATVHEDRKSWTHTERVHTHRHTVCHT